MGDSAVAVNPNDERYADLIGQKQLGHFLELRFQSADEHIDPEFGTGKESNAGS